MSPSRNGKVTIEEEVTVIEGHDPAKNKADMIRRGHGWSGHRVKDRTAPFTPASCSSPDATGPNPNGRRQHRKQAVSPTSTSMVPSFSRGGLECIWACCTGSLRVRPVRPLSSCTTGKDRAAWNDLRHFFQGEKEQLSLGLVFDRGTERAEKGVTEGGEVMEKVSHKCLL